MVHITLKTTCESPGTAESVRANEPLGAVEGARLATRVGAGSARQKIWPAERYVLFFGGYKTEHTITKDARNCDLSDPMAFYQYTTAVSLEHQLLGTIGNMLLHEGFIIYFEKQ